MAKNLYSLQLLRNGNVFTSYTEAVTEVQKGELADGVIKLARYKDASTDPYSGGTGGNVKTIFAIRHSGIDNQSGWTIFESYKEVVDEIREKIDEMSGEGAGSIAEQIKAAIDGLNSRKDAGESEVFSAVYQDSGVTSASTRNLTSVKLAGYEAPTTTNTDNTLSKNKVAATDDLGTALEKLQTQINSMDKAASAADGQVVTTVVEADGKVSETKANVKDLQLGGYTKNAATVSGAVGSTDTINTAISKLENNIAALSDSTDAKIEALDATATTTTSQVFDKITQTDGKVSATTKLATSLVMSGLAATADTKIAATDTLGEALAKLQGQIDSMDLAAVSAEGSVITSVSESDGKVSAAATPVKDVKLTGYVKDTTKTGDIVATDDIEDALSKLENKAAAITITNADGTINVTTGASGTDINVNVKSGEKVIKKDDNGGLYTDLDLVKITENLPSTVKERYQLLASDDSQIGVNIDIAKDSHIVSIKYITDSSDDHYQNLEYKYLDASGNTKTEYVDISSLVLESEFASGITVTNHVAHGVVDPASEKNSGDTASFLTVGENGFKVDGIKQEIINRINELDVTDAAAAGEYVSAVNETDGKVAMTRANVSDAVLNGYTKGTDATAIVATDSLKAALSKLENQVDKAKAAATTKVAEGTDAGNNMTIASATSETDGSVTYTINLTDVASDSALTAEIAARKAVDGQTGQTYAVNSSSNFLKNATSLNDADLKLDTELKKAEDEIGLVNGKYQAPSSGYASGATTVSQAIAQLNEQAMKNTIVAGDGIEITEATNGTTITVDLKDNITTAGSEWENPLKFDSGKLYFDSLDCGTY